MSVVTQQPAQSESHSSTPVPGPHRDLIGEMQVTAPTQPKTTTIISGRWSWKTRAALVVAVTAVIGTAVAWKWSSGGSVDTTNLVFQVVERGELEITVIERGNLESQSNLEVICEVDDVRRDGINGTPLIWVIENGMEVKKGDLLVELDSAPIQERLDEQILETEQARERYMLAQSAYDNQVTQNETNEAEAELKVRLAELELDMFRDEENGTHKLEVEAIKRLIDDLNNEILAAQASLELKKNDKQGIETLFRLGYAGKSELDKARLDFLQAESQYAAKINRLRTQLSALKKKETYERDMQLLQLDGRLNTAKRGLAQVIRNNEARLTQAKASLEARKELLHKEQELLARYQDQLQKCKIYAPQDGMVAYASSRNETIRPGLAVRARQHILSLPDLSKMQVSTSIHESVLDQVSPGLKATVRVDAFPENVYEGTVKQVAVLPDQTGWYNADTKAYTTTIVIDQDVENLKPGMTAVVEIHVQHLHDVVTVPVQAVVPEGKRTYCYVKADDGKIERREVKVGPTNDRIVQVLSGVKEGEQVVLNPSALAAKDEGRDKPKESRSREA